MKLHVACPIFVIIKTSQILFPLKDIFHFYKIVNQGAGKMFYSLRALAQLSEYLD